MNTNKHYRIRNAFISNVCNDPSKEHEQLIILFFFLTDIQECYEVTLQLNTEQSVVKEDSTQDAWEVIFPASQYRLEKIY